MLKVQILDTCPYCQGEAMMFVAKDIHCDGQTYERYRPCYMCHGSGEYPKWVSLVEFANLLEKAVAMEPDYKELAQHKPATQYHDSREAAGI
jgi:hypothetical protein